MGISIVRNESCHPVLWKPDLKIIDLGLLPGCVFGFAQAINDRSEVLVNFASSPEFVGAFLVQLAQNPLENTAPKPTGRGRKGLCFPDVGKAGWDG